MAQNDRALFLYGMDVTQNNKYINFRATFGGPELTATLTVGNYTMTELLFEIKKQMELVSPAFTFSWTIDRTISSGTSNRIHVTTSSAYFDLLFGSGTNSANSPAGLLGFMATDYTGAVSYTGFQGSGSILVPEFPTLDYLSPDSLVTQDGAKNVSAAGIKETLVFSQMKFMQGQWKWITNYGNRTQYTQWVAFMKYATRQLKFEFTPSINEDVNAFYKVTLESTPEDGNGLGYRLVQMRGDGLYRFYDSGLLKFRVVPD